MKQWTRCARALPTSPTRTTRDLRLTHYPQAYRLDGVPSGAREGQGRGRGGGGTDAVHAIGLGAKEELRIDAEQAAATVVVHGGVGSVAIVDAEERVGQHRVHPRRVVPTGLAYDSISLRRLG